MDNYYYPSNSSAAGHSACLSSLCSEHREAKLKKKNKRIRQPSPDGQRPEGGGKSKRKNLTRSKGVMIIVSGEKNHCSRR